MLESRLKPTHPSIVYRDPKPANKDKLRELGAAQLLIDAIKRNVEDGEYHLLAGLVVALGA